jgi:hypothetical protein
MPRTKLDQFRSFLKLNGAGFVNRSEARQSKVAIANAAARGMKGFAARGIVFWARWYSKVPTTVSINGK